MYKNTIQHSVKYTLSALLKHYWNGLDEPSMMSSIVGTQLDGGDLAL
jgi:hypothetical protein